jgi:hypothetical protein
MRISFVFFVTVIASSILLSCCGNDSRSLTTNEKACLLYFESLSTVQDFIEPQRPLDEADFRCLDKAVDRLEDLTGILSGTDSPFGRVVTPQLAEANTRWIAWYENNNGCIEYDNAIERIVVRPKDGCPVPSDPLGPGVLVEAR